MKTKTATDDLKTLVAVARAAANAALAPYGFEVTKGDLEITALEGIAQSDDVINAKGSACICVNGVCGCIIY
ncbi:MAG: hypothetical protein ABJO67_16475 [Pseudoruegeria sp.]